MIDFKEQAQLAVNNTPDLDSIIGELFTKEPEELVAIAGIDRGNRKKTATDFFYLYTNFLLVNGIAPGTEIDRKRILEYYGSHTLRHNPTTAIAEALADFSEEGIEFNKHSHRHNEIWIDLPSKKDMDAAYFSLLNKKGIVLSNKNNKEVDEVVNSIFSKKPKQLVDELGLPDEVSAATATNIIYLYFSYLLAKGIAPGTEINRKRILEYYQLQTKVSDSANKSISLSLNNFEKEGVNLNKHFIVHRYLGYDLPQKEELDAAYLSIRTRKNRVVYSNQVKKLANATGRNKDLDDVLANLFTKNPEQIVKELNLNVDTANITGAKVSYIYFSYLIANGISSGTEIDNERLLEYYSLHSSASSENKWKLDEYLMKAFKVFEKKGIDFHTRRENSTKFHIIPPKKDLDMAYADIRHGKRAIKSDERAIFKSSLLIDQNLDAILSELKNISPEDLINQGKEIKNAKINLSNLLYSYLKFLLSNNIGPGTYVPLISLRDYCTVKLPDLLKPGYLSSSIDRLNNTLDLDLKKFKWDTWIKLPTPQNMENHNSGKWIHAEKKVKVMKVRQNIDSHLEDAIENVMNKDPHEFMDESSIILNSRKMTPENIVYLFFRGLLSQGIAPDTEFNRESLSNYYLVYGKLCPHSDKELSKIINRGLSYFKRQGIDFKQYTLHREHWYTIPAQEELDNAYSLKLSEKQKEPRKQKPQKIEARKQEIKEHENKTTQVPKEKPRYIPYATRDYISGLWEDMKFEVEVDLPESIEIMLGTSSYSLGQMRKKLGSDYMIRKAVLNHNLEPTLEKMMQDNRIFKDNNNIYHQIEVD